VEGKNMGRKTEDRASPNRKAAKKQGKKKALKKRQLRRLSYNQKNVTLNAMQLLELIAYGPNTFGTQ
jgi:hypothetical protein